MLKISKPKPTASTVGLIYGPSGTGKTTFASTAPKPLLLDINEAGTDSILGSNVDVAYLKSWQEVIKAKNDIVHAINYQTIIIDTMTSLQDLRYVETTKGKMVAEFADLTKAQWGGIASDLKTFIYDLKDTGKNVLFLAHQKTFGGDEDGGDEAGIKPERNARMMPSVVGTLNGICDFIGNSFINEKFIKMRVPRKDGKDLIKTVRKFTYCLRIGPNPVYVTKIRSPHRDIPDFIENPSWGDVVGIMRGK